MAAADNLENADLADEEPTTAPMTRRLLLRRAVSLGVAAPVLLTVLQACGDDDDEDENGNGGDDETPTVEAEETEATETEPAGTTNGISTPPGGATPIGSPMGSPSASPMGSPSASPVSLEGTLASPAPTSGTVPEAPSPAA
jgi:hypothetical protein